MLRSISDHNTKGQQAELIAQKYLQTQGLSIIQSNFSCRLGEIDLIMQDNEFLVFIEVRYRKKTHYGHPLETINFAKQQKIIKTIQYFLLNKPQYNNVPYRVDALAIHSQTPTGQEHIDWVKNAIQG
ncbi:YraN family protein [sulfur-oxidizing endosymbiont of Gigantopelta aegis]|uniref:YraN family protein n=1 Tax=sulfur-oxidizing endosymbiont of Gigantopelta aegis TaxID=2794934 RepID=UPI0018DEBC1F|nr:YraN family protein [sulfur-oxidizing endosymbiont of Gigantopelta aegis]